MGGRGLTSDGTGVIVVMMKLLTFVLTDVAPFSSMSSALLLTMFSSCTKDIVVIVPDTHTIYLITKLVEKLYYQVVTCLPDSSCVDHGGASTVLHGGCGAHASSPGMPATDAFEHP